jgi:ribosome-binding ATPase YchF (GTP1/OBG family)
VGYEDLLAADGSMALVRERGRLRLEGKEYELRDGEICHFRFNVR